MGRAGGGGGGHSSGGGHSMGHSSGGHHVGSSGSHSRAGGGGGFSHGNGGFGGGAPMHHSTPSHHHYHGGFGAPPPPPMYGGYGAPPPPRRRPFGVIFMTYLIVTIIILAVVFIPILANSGSSTKSTINREKVDSGNAYINDCIIDEIGWFDNISSTEKKLKDFWSETGVQPYIILKAYDSSLTTDSQKEAWATSYYDENFSNENIFLFVYYAEKDTDNDVGYMTYTNGLQTSSVMDSEAVEIFWNYIDKYWYSNLSTDDMFVTVFNKTASTIMRVSTTGADVLKYVVIFIGAIVVICLVIHLTKLKRKAEKERAEETERILNSSMADLVNEKLQTDELKDLTDKYD